MLVKIPLIYQKTKTDGVDEYDWEGMGLTKPEDSEVVLGQMEAMSYIDSKMVYWIEENIEGDGCFLHLHNIENELLCPLDAEKAARIINQVETI